MSISDKINSFRDGTNAWLTVVLKLFALVAIILGIAWLGLSVYANFQEYNFIEIKNDVSIEKAQYEFKIGTTGEILLTEDFDSVKSGDRSKYVLHGYYKIIGEKWKYNKSDLTLDENYFGRIDYQLRY